MDWKYYCETFVPSAPPLLYVQDHLQTDQSCAQRARESNAQLSENCCFLHSLHCFLPTFGFHSHLQSLVNYQKPPITKAELANAAATELDANWIGQLHLHKCQGSSLANCSRDFTVDSDYQHYGPLLNLEHRGLAASQSRDFLEAWNHSWRLILSPIFVRLYMSLQRSSVLLVLYSCLCLQF